MTEYQKLMHELTLAKAVFQMRSIQAVLCASARSKPDQETSAARPTPASEGQE